MDSSTKCPVCGREGIPDYHQGEVRCPGCGSNLEVFRVLDTLDDELKAKSSKWKPIAMVCAGLALIFALLYFTKGSSSSSAQEMGMMRDSIAALHEQINDLKAAAPVKTAEAQDGKKSETAEPAKADEKKEVVTAPAGKVSERNGKKYYKVERGDNLWKICRKLYGDGKVKPEDIARLNGISSTDQLEIDQELQVQ